MKLPSFLKKEADKLKPFRDYMRSEIAKSGVAPEVNFYALISQFAQVFYDDFDKYAKQNKDFEQIYLQAFNFSERAISYFKSIDKIPSDTVDPVSIKGALGILTGLFGGGSKQAAPPPPPQQKDYTGTIIIVSVVLLAALLILKK